MKKNRIIIIVIAAIVVIGGGIAAYFLNNQPKQGSRGTTASDVTITQDADTGEQLSNDPSLAPSESEDSGTIIVLGLADLIDAATLTSQQSDFVKDQLNIYGTQNLKDKYDTLTIQPQNTKVDGDTITGTVRLGDGDTTVALKFISGTKSGTMQLFVTDPLNTGGGNYTSPTAAVYAD